MAAAQDDSALLDKLAELVDKTIAFGSKSQLSLNRSMSNLKRADSRTSLAKETEIIKVEPKPIFRLPSLGLLNESGLVVSTKRRIITSPESIESDSDLIQRLEEIMEKSAAENIRKDTIKEESEPINDELDQLLDRSANISSRMSSRRNIPSRGSNASRAAFTPIPRIPSVSNLAFVVEQKPSSSISIPIRVVSSTSAASIQDKPKPLLPARTISSTSTRPDAFSRVPYQEHLFPFF
jgi:predicted transcriptional regulator